MFGVQKYFNMLVNSKWYFDESKKNDIEDLLYVDFKKVDDHFVLERIRYTVMDILLAIEEMDVVIKKVGQEIQIKIINI